MELEDFIVTPHSNEHSHEKGNYLYWLTGIGLLLVGSGAWLLFGENTPESEVVIQNVSSNSGDSVMEDDRKSGEVLVDVSGAVKNPGVYSFDYGDRVSDALAAAGGLVEDADAAWVNKSVNRAAKLEDGAKIYIPFEGESEGVSDSTVEVLGAVGQSKISINSASQGELESLWGIGEQTAKAIIGGRPYQRVEQLIENKIIKQNVWERNKENFSL